MNWELTPDEFLFAWEAAGFDTAPVPLSVRVSARTEAARTADLHRLRQWHTDTVDAEFAVALRVLAAPHTRFTGFGAHDGAVVRVLAAAQGRTGVVVRQQPAGDPEVGGGLTVSLGHAEHLARRFVGALPEREPGRHAARRARLADLKQRPVLPSAADSDAVVIRRILSGQRCGIGCVVVHTRLDESAVRPDYVLSWVDIAGDGRYLVRTREEVSLLPGDRAEFVTAVSELVAESNAVTRIGVR